MYNLLLSQKLSIRILRHLVLFLSMVLLFAWVVYSRSGEPASFWSGYLMVFTNALFFFGYAYITVYLLIPKFLLKRKILVFFIAFVLTGLTLSLLKFLFSAEGAEEIPPGRRVAPRAGRSSQQQVPHPPLSQTCIRPGSRLAQA